MPKSNAFFNGKVYLDTKNLYLKTVIKKSLMFMLNILLT